MAGLTTFLPMYAVALVLLTKISLLKNIISKNELIQTVKIYKSRDVSKPYQFVLVQLRDVPTDFQGLVDLYVPY